MLKPKDVSERLSISPATLRLWSTKFESFLSPSARRSLTENGGPAQRRYSEEDLALFRTAKHLLQDGLTYEDVVARLPETPIVEYDNTPSHSLQPLPTPPIGEVVSAYEQAIGSLKQTIMTQQELIEELRKRPERPTLPPLTFRQRLDWLLRGRMIEQTEHDYAPTRSAVRLSAD